MASIDHKRGDTFRISVAVTEDDKTTPVDITGWTIRSHVRNGSVLIAELEYSAIDEANGQYQLLCEDTTDWPRATIESDIEYIDLLGDVRSTATYQIEVIKDVTYD
jgi:hypothetical protein